MSSYTPNIGLENPAYLSETNTWGTSLNTSRSIIDVAVTGRATFNLTGTTFSITVTNGTVTTATSRVWTFTGTPGGTCTVTFAPNSAQNWVFVNNQTPSSLIFKQGSGSTGTVLSGSSNIVYFDGTGATANTTLFQSTPTQGPGSVTAPSYSFTGFSDVGIYCPAAHTLGIAANGVEVASFASSGAGPSGLNTLGATLGPFIGNAFSNLDMFTGWGGPAVPPGYCFLYLNESTGEIWVKYLDSTSTQRTAVVGNYGPGNVANYAGAAPPTIINRDYYFEVNESKSELDFYYKDSSSVPHGPIPVCSYSPGQIAIFTGSAPATVADYYSWFIVNESTDTLNWYYQDSTGGSHGPVVIGSYAATAGWTTYVPTFSSGSGDVTLNAAVGSFIQTGKSVTVQILLEVTASFGALPTSDTFTISIPVACYSGAGSFAQSLSCQSDAPTVISNLYGTATVSSHFTVNATIINNGASVFLSFNGVYQVN
jgi:hypothetical protein